MACDSVVNLTLTVNAVDTINVDSTICEGEFVTIGTSTYNTSGVYQDILTSNLACDSVVNLTLTVNAVDTINVDSTICEGEFVTIGTSTYSTSGVYQDILTSSLDCDSIVNLTLTVNDVDTVSYTHLTLPTTPYV